MWMELLRHYNNKIRGVIPWILLISTFANAEILSFFDPITYNDKNRAIFKTHAFLANDPVSIKDFFNQWHGKFHPKSGTNLAVDDGRIDIGISLKKYGYFGYTYRHQSFIQASEDTVLLVYQQNNKTGFTTGKNYELDISIEGFEVDGAVYAKSFKIYENSNRFLKFGFGFELLRGHNVQYGYVKGNAYANSEKDYNFYAVSDYYYSINYLYDLDVIKPTGSGYTTHFSIHYKNKNFEFKTIINDLYGVLKWKNIPYSYVVLNSANKEYDNDGYVQYNPTASGIEKYVNFTQKLYKKCNIESKYIIENSTLFLGTDLDKNSWFPYIKYNYSFSHQTDLEISYENRFKILGLGFRYKDFKLAINSNDYQKPSALSFNISYLHQF